jgi:hypothetical protein
MAWFLMGIVTMCIGIGPLGVLAIGALSEWLGPFVAIFIMACLGLVGLSLVWVCLIKTWIAAFNFGSGQEERTGWRRERDSNRPVLLRTLGGSSAGRAGGSASGSLLGQPLCRGWPRAGVAAI